MLSGFSPLYQSKLQEEIVQEIVNINTKNFDPYGGLFDQVLSQYNVKPIKNQDAHNQLEMMKR